MNNDLIESIAMLHTTEMGAKRIKRNLELADDDAVAWCRSKIMDKNTLIKRYGKNWYVHIDDYVITVNASSYTIITAHRKRRRTLNDD